MVKKAIKSKENRLQQLKIDFEFLSFYHEQSKALAITFFTEIGMKREKSLKSMKIDTHTFLGDLFPSIILIDIA